MKRYFFIGVVLGATLLFFGWLGFYKTFLDWDITGDSHSDITTAESYESPNKRYTANIYYESGGGAAGWVFEHVSVSDGSGYAYTGEDDVLCIVPAQNDIELTWVGTNTLLVVYQISEHTTVFRNQPQRIDDVTVIFKPYSVEPKEMK